MQTALVEYQNRLQELQAGSAQANVRQSAALALMAIVLTGFVLLCIASYLKRTEPPWLPVLFLAPAAWSWRQFLQIRREVSNISRLQRFYRSGVDRLTGDWAGKGASGDEFIPTGHLYAQDLNLFGDGIDVRIAVHGAHPGGPNAALASYLLDLPDKDETIARQEAVKELEPQSGLREQICLLGQCSFQSCEWEPFREWLESPALTTPRAISWMMAAMTCALALMVLIPWLAPVNAGLWTRVAPYLFSLAVVQIGLALWLRPMARALLNRARGIAGELTVLQDGLALSGDAFVPLRQTHQTCPVRHGRRGRRSQA